MGRWRGGNPDPYDLAVCAACGSQDARHTLWDRHQRLIDERVRRNQVREIRGVNAARSPLNRIQVTERIRKLAKRRAVCLRSWIKRRNTVRFEITIHAVGGEIRTADRYPNALAALQQVHLWVEKNTPASLEAENGCPGE